MAVRPVFVPLQRAPFFRPVEISFEWHGGFAVSQSQKNIRAIHEGFNRIYPNVPVLEISSKSWQEHGKDLSAFHMAKSVGEEKICVESLYQAGKVFRNGGPYLDLPKRKPKEAKRDTRLKTSGPLISYYFDGQRFPLNPTSMFYNYLWLNALLENPELANVVLQYGAFTDIIFSSNSVNCQAAAAAAFVSLHKLGLLEQVKSVETFYKLLTDKEYTEMLVDTDQAAIKEVFDLKAVVNRNNAGDLFSVNESLTEKGNKRAGVEKISPQRPKVLLAIDSVVSHKKFGEGKIITMTSSTVKILFPEVGEKELGKDWVEKNCEFVK